MVDERRLAASLLTGLMALLSLAVVALANPMSAMGLAGDTSSPGARVALVDVSITGLSLTGTEVDNIAAARWAAPSARLEFILERDVNYGSFAPGAGTRTFRMTGQSRWSSVVLDTSRACVSGVQVPGLALPEGLIDTSISEAVSDGFTPNAVTDLLAVLEPSQPTVTAEALFGEGLFVGAAVLEIEGLQLTHTPRQVDPIFTDSCLQ